MKIKYEFINGDKSEIEVSDEIGMIIYALRLEEESSERNNRRYCYSIDALKYNDKDVHMPVSAENPESINIRKEENKELYEAFSKLSETQKRRLLLLASGMSVNEIARREGITPNAAWKSAENAKKILKKFLKKGV